MPSPCGHRRARRARAGPEVARRILGIDAAFDGAVQPRRIALSAAEPHAGGHGHLLGDQIATGDLLGDRMFHLDARVHLEKIELAAIHVHEEFDRARAPVLQWPCEGDGGQRQVRRNDACSRGAGVSSISFW